MTLIVAATSPKSIWMLADRRISFFPRGRPRDNARKILQLDTTDAKVLVGYSGLGLTARGVEPSDWMSSVLRGYKIDLDLALKVLGHALRKQLPPHLDELRRGGIVDPWHHVLVAGFVNGVPRVYLLRLLPPWKEKPGRFDFVRLTGRHKHRLQEGVEIFAIGSGQQTLDNHDRLNRRAKYLDKLIKAHDRGVASHVEVTRHLAELNYFVHQNTEDQSVGDRCVVFWRKNDGSGSFETYTGTQRDRGGDSWPVISNGWDMGAIAQVFFDHHKAANLARRTVDVEELNAALRTIPARPDDALE